MKKPAHAGFFMGATVQPRAARGVCPAPRSPHQCAATLATPVTTISVNGHT